MITELKSKLVDAQNNIISNMVQKEILLKQRKHSIDVKIANKQFEIFRVVLTGGPCAGKTTAITSIATRLRENGFNVFIVPEAASMIFTSGGDINLANYSDKMKVRF